MSDIVNHLRDLAFGAYHNLPFSPETNIYEREWDVCIILDACRVDALTAVADEYDYIHNIQTLWSLGSNSREWMDETFVPEYDDAIQETAYVTGNPYSDKCLDRERFEILDEVWTYAWDDGIGTVPPRPVTDRAIETWTEQSSRMIVHYMQPHFPSIPDPIGTDLELETFGSEALTVWEDLETGHISPERAWSAYLSNLSHVLDDVRLLLRNITAETVVLTADHGNGFGEWGIYGHPVHKPLPEIRRVPWVVTEGTGQGNYEPQTERSKRTPEAVTSRLRDLGYL